MFSHKAESAKDSSDSTEFCDFKMQNILPRGYAFRNDASSYRLCEGNTRSDLPSLYLCEEVGTALQESVPMPVIARLDEIKSWQSIKTQIFLEKTQNRKWIP